jgi:hypothetical protein
MGLVLLVAVLALGCGLLAGGRLTRLTELRLRRPGLPVGALAAQLLGALVLSGGAYGVALLAGAGLAAWFVLLNVRTPGLALIGLGLACNGLVVGLNGAMPVSVRAAERAGLDEWALSLDDDPRHSPITSATRWPWLGDVLPVASPVRPEVVSPGDVLVAAGVGLLLWYGVRGRRTEPAPSLPATRDVPDQFS